MTVLHGRDRDESEDAETHRKEPWTREAWVAALSGTSHTNTLEQRASHSIRVTDWSVSPVRHVSKSSTEVLASRFVVALDKLRLTNSWYAFAPGMFGKNPTLDAAVRAIVLLCIPSTEKTASTYEALSQSAYRSALESLRISLDTSDFSLMTTGILALYEMLRKDNGAALRTHAQGIAAIILARARAELPATPVLRAALYDNNYITFVFPMVSGQSSPFEDVKWLDLDPAAVSPIQSPVVRLTKLAYQGMIRLPGLIVMVREIRQDFVAATDIIPKAIRTAAELLVLKNEKAEDEILGRVTITPAASHLHRRLGLRSFKFRAATERHALLLYWAVRLMTLKLCLVLCHVERPDEYSHVHMYSSELEREQESLILSILMSWRDGFGAVNMFGILWGALQGRDRVRKHPAQMIRDWLLQMQNEDMADWKYHYTAADMDVEAEVLAGGALAGFTVDTIRGMAKS